METVLKQEDVVYNKYFFYGLKYCLGVFWIQYMILSKRVF